MTDPVEIVALAIPAEGNAGPRYVDRAAIAALRAAGVAVIDWRPIEEAPEGVSLLVSDGENIWVSGKIAPTVKSRDGMPADGQDWYIEDGCSRPTKFMPLPKPPGEIG